MYSVILLMAMAQPPVEAPATGGAPPEQVVAIIDGKGKLTMVLASSGCTGCYGVPQPETTVHARDEKGKGTIAVKVKVSSIVMTTAELPAKYVEAYTVEGKAISSETLATLLAKERTVLVTMDGKKPDPFHLQLYKEGTIVLVPPANALNPGGVGYVGVGGVPVPAPFADPAPAPPLPPERKP